MKRTSTHDFSQLTEDCRVVTAVLAGKSSDAASASSRIPTTIIKEMYSGMSTHLCAIIFAPIKVNTKDSHTVRNRRRDSTPASRKYMARRPRIAKTLEV